MSVIDVATGAYRSVKQLPRKIFGTRNDRLLKVYRRQVAPINEFESAQRGDFDERLAARIESDRIDDAPEEERESVLRTLRVELSSDLLEASKRMKQQVATHSNPLHDWWYGLAPTQRLEDYYRSEYRKRNIKLTESLAEAGLLSEGFALVREASRRAQNHRHFDCQLIGGRVLFEGNIAEMKTGEGKTIVCHLAAFMNYLCGRKVHVITVNDYLVQRDAQFAEPIFELVGVSVGYIQSQQDPGGREGIRHGAYGCDITFGTNSEFGFDYLRDNMKSHLAEQVQGRLDFVIVDEVDSILIDEARTPLIISGPADDDVTRYPRADKVAEELVRRQAVWDRKVRRSVDRFDGDARNIPKLLDAMNILGYKERTSSDKKEQPAQATENTDAQKAGEASIATLGPDFLTDDQVEAFQFYENDILKIPPSEQYRRYFIVQMERKQVGLTHDGVTIAQELLDLGSLYSGANMEWPHLIENALRAHKVYQRDKDYVVQDGQIVIVDPFTGRLMVGRQWSDGLHQACEARERVRVKEESQTLATITIQNFIKLYLLRAGMTGTALTEATEFDKIYKLDVVEIPTNRPVNRIDHNDKMYRDTSQKYEAIVEEIHEVRRRGRVADPFALAEALGALQPIQEGQGQDSSKIDQALGQFNKAELGDVKVIQFMLDTYDEVIGDLARGRPVLVGTTSVENSEVLSRLLTQTYGIDHEVLNAKNHSREADIVAKAGHCSAPTKGRDKTPLGNVTIATNMAGRGTDIKLGEGVVYSICKVPASLPEGSEPDALYPAGITKCCMKCEEYDPATNCAHCFKPKIDSRFPELGRKVCPITVPCGLHIIGTERHEARRIDNQLRGRSGRQGDPGSSRFSLSLQDDLLKLFMPDWMLKMMEKLGFTDGTSLEDKRLTKGIERAQRKVEERNFSTRKHLLEWDEPMDFQRKEFYSERQRILEERDLPGLIFSTIDDSIESAVSQYLGGTYHRTCIAQWCHSRLDLAVDEQAIEDEDLEAAQDSIRLKAKDEAHDQIRTSIGEYIDPEEPPNKWDVGGLLQWAQRAFRVSMTQNQMRKMDPSEIEEVLIEAANAHYDHVDLGGIRVFLEEHHAQRALADWARVKFNIKIDEEEVIETGKEEVGSIIHNRVREAYLKREISFPVEWAIDWSLGGGDSTDHAAAAERLVHWANAKYGLNWTVEDVQGKPVEQLRQTLVDTSAEFFEGALEKEINENVAGKEKEDAIEWARNRFGPAWNERRFNDALDAGNSPEAGSNGSSTDGLGRALLDQGREMLRYELTRLEQFVLLRLYDQAWKDHLLEMDHLKNAIMQRPLGGDQTHPQSQFAIEGRELFLQMWARIAERVTDIVFKIRIGGGEVATSPQDSPASGGRPVSFGHADSTGAGFATASRDQEAAMRAQNTDGKVETIRRVDPKIGRNAPCPCGSGKKFKQCHGKR